ncbi:MAG: HAD-IA family hydrolase [Pseudomonadota bacterium]
MIKLIIFDWDGTLMDSAYKITNCIAAAAIEVGIEPPEHDDAKLVIGLGLFEAMQRLFPDQSNQTLLALVEAYKQHFVSADSTPQPLFEGVREGLARLEESGVALAVATGKSRVGLDRVLDESDLRSVFHTTRCADEARTKPHPQLLLDIFDFTAIAPRNAIMIGDTTFDMEMAAAAQTRRIGVDYGVHSKSSLKKLGVETICATFNEVIEVLMQSEMEPVFQ